MPKPSLSYSPIPSLACIYICIRNRACSNNMAAGVLKTSPSWVVDIHKKLNEVDPSKELALWSKQSIYRVPACIKDLNPKAYKPQIISLGPYHHDDPQLLPMEDHKQRALVHFLKRAKKSIDEFLEAMDEVEPLLLASYQGLDEKWNDKELFLQLMIVDGCFMLEVLRVATGHISADYVANDPIFSNHGMLYTVPYIKRDMLMLENQLPLLVLQKLVTVETGTVVEEDQINKLVLKFLAPNVRHPTMPLGLHPLDVFRKSLLQGPTKRSPCVERDDVSSEIIRSAMELDEAGIRFRTNKSNSLRDISFRHGILYLPVIVVDDATEYMFLNLMTFERLHMNASNEVTAYVFFMDNIIDSAKDVSLLHSKGIIQNALGSDKAVAKLFNSLSKDVVLDPESSLEDVHNRVNKYCRKRWNMWRANLIHTYFRSPWAFLSLLAAIFLLALTVAQTFYSIYQYYVPHENS